MTPVYRILEQRSACAATCQSRREVASPDLVLCWCLRSMSMVCLTMRRVLMKGVMAFLLCCFQHVTSIIEPPRWRPFPDDQTRPPRDQNVGCVPRTCAYGTVRMAPSLTCASCD